MDRCSAISRVCALNKEQDLECLTPSQLYMLQLQLNSQCQKRAAQPTGWLFPPLLPLGQAAPTPLSLAVQSSEEQSAFTFSAVAASPAGVTEAASCAKTQNRH